MENNWSRAKVNDYEWYMEIAKCFYFKYFMQSWVYIIYFYDVAVLHESYLIYAYCYNAQDNLFTLTNTWDCKEFCAMPFESSNSSWIICQVS